MCSMVTKTLVSYKVSDVIEMASANCCTLSPSLLFEVYLPGEFCGSSLILCSATKEVSTNVA